MYCKEIISLFFSALIQMSSTILYCKENNQGLYNFQGIMTHAHQVARIGPLHMMSRIKVITISRYVFIECGFLWKKRREK